EFRIGTDGDPDAWLVAPAPSAVRVIPVPGPNQLYSITWPDGSILNTRLRVTVKANDRTGLAAPDVFYFSSLVGETGDGDGRTRAMPRVTAIDLSAVKRVLNTPEVPKTGVADFNRDGRVNALDLAAVRSNLNQFLPPLTAAPPPAAAAATASLRE